jgi:Fe-S-cluster containining protein
MDGAKKKGARIACRGKGCHWCCYDVSVISRVELGALLGAFRRLPVRQRERVKAQYLRWMEAHALLPGLFIDPEEDAEANREIAKNTVEESMKQDTPCMFLLDGACAVYESRPLVCRGHHVVGDDPDICRRRNLGIEAAGSLNILHLLIGTWHSLGTQYIPSGELHCMVERYGGPEWKRSPSTTSPSTKAVPAAENQ